jgi:hypothetical protein
MLLEKKIYWVAKFWKCFFKGRDTKKFENPCLNPVKTNRNCLSNFSFKRVGQIKLKESIFLNFFVQAFQYSYPMLWPWGLWALLMVRFHLNILDFSDNSLTFIAFWYLKIKIITNPLKTINQVSFSIKTIFVFGKRSLKISVRFFKFSYFLLASVIF